MKVLKKWLEKIELFLSEHEKVYFAVSCTRRIIIKSILFIIPWVFSFFFIENWAKFLNLKFNSRGLVILGLTLSCLIFFAITRRGIKKEIYDDVENGEYNVKEFIVEIIGASIVLSLFSFGFFIKTDIRLAIIVFVFTMLLLAINSIFYIRLYKAGYVKKDNGEKELVFISRLVKNLLAMVVIAVVTFVLFVPLVIILEMAFTLFEISSMVRGAVMAVLSLGMFLFFICRYFYKQAEKDLYINKYSLKLFTISMFIIGVVYTLVDIFIAMLTESIKVGIIGLIVVIVNVILAIFMYYFRAEISRKTEENISIY